MGKEDLGMEAPAGREGGYPRALTQEEKGHNEVPL